MPRQTEMEYRVFGKKEAAQTVMFIHGWPDSDELFKHQYPALEATHRIVAFTLPMYKRDSATSHPFFGYPLKEVVAMYKAGVDSAMEGRSEKPIIVCHDWGAMLTWELLDQFPEIAAKVIGLDIAQHTGKKDGKQIAIILTYQWLLCFFYVLPGPIGNFFTKQVAKFFGAPNVAGVHANMNYLYFQMWKSIFTKSMPKSLGRFAPPKIPILYMHATVGPLKWYSKRWLEYIENTPGCRNVAVEADHWFMARRKTSEKVTREIVKFISE